MIRLNPAAARPTEVAEMDGAAKDAGFFFERHRDVYPLYELFHEKLLARFPDTRVKVQKSQISY